MTITGPRKKDPSYTLRRVFVHSSANADAARRARARKLEQAAGKSTGSPAAWARGTTPTQPRSPLASAPSRPPGASQTTCAPNGTGPDGRPTLDWRFDQAAIDAEAATDGWYALLTNLDPAAVPATAVLARYKNQPAASERRYHDLKGPLAVAPMFLHSNRRITAIIGVICMALLIYCLAERQARRNLAPALRLDGLCAAARPSPRPLMFATLATLRLRAGADGRPPQIPQPDLVQQRLLDLLEIDPRKLADPPHLMQNYGSRRASSVLLEHHVNSEGIPER